MTVHAMEEYIKPEPNKENYRRALDAVEKHWQSRERRPRLLLHSCCAPCSSSVLEELCRYFDITLLYYNPNIATEAEFTHRVQELARFCRAAGLDRVREDAEGHALAAVEILVPPYDHQEFLAIARGYERCPERGERCHRCYRQRLAKAAACAAEGQYDYFCTTLSLSPLKSAEILNAIGRELAADAGVPFLPSDFKKRGGYQRSIELSRQYGLYRQNFCGCEFSRTAAADGMHAGEAAGKAAAD